MPSNKAFQDKHRLADFMKRLPSGFEFSVTATGKSMEPTMRSGDVVQVKRARIEMVRVGTVVAFIQPKTSSLVLHRVVGRVVNGRSVKLQTKGDANSWADPWRIDRSNFLGIAVLPFSFHQKIGFQVFFDKLFHISLAPLKRLIVGSSKFFC